MYRSVFVDIISIFHLELKAEAARQRVDRIGFANSQRDFIRLAVSIRIPVTECDQDIFEFLQIRRNIFSELVEPRLVDPLFKSHAARRAYIDGRNCIHMTVRRSYRLLDLRVFLINLRQVGSVFLNQIVKHHQLSAPHPIGGNLVYFDVAFQENVRQLIGGKEKLLVLFKSIGRYFLIVHMDVC